MITELGYEIDTEGNIGNETRRIEDLQLRFILLMTILNSNKRVIWKQSKGCQNMHWSHATKKVEFPCPN